MMQIIVFCYPLGINQSKYLSLSHSLSFQVCLSLSLFVRRSLSLSLSLSVSLSLPMSVCLTVIRPSVCLSLALPVSVCLSVCLSLCLSLSLSLSVSLCLCLSLSFSLSLSFFIFHLFKQQRMIEHYSKVPPIASYVSIRYSIEVSSKLTCSYFDFVSLSCCPCDLSLTMDILSVISNLCMTFGKFEKEKVVIMVVVMVVVVLVLVMMMVMMMIMTLSKGAIRDFFSTISSLRRQLSPTRRSTLKCTGSGRVQIVCNTSGASLA